MLQQFAEPLAICGGDQFKGRAYEKAARAVATTVRSLRGIGACLGPAADQPYRVRRRGHAGDAGDLSGYQKVAVAVVMSVHQRLLVRVCSAQP